MRRNARSKVECNPVEMIAGTRRANRIALLQAGEMWVAEVPAARPLCQVAAESSDAADLWRRQTHSGSCETGIRRLYAGISSERFDRHQSTNAHSSVTA